MRTCSPCPGRRSSPINAPKASCGKCAAPRIPSNIIPTPTHLSRGPTDPTSEYRFLGGMMIDSKTFAGAIGAAALICAAGALAADNAQAPPFAFMDGGWQAMGADFQQPSSG